MYAYNPDRRGLSEVKILNLEPWRLYPRGSALDVNALLGCPKPSLRITKRTPIASIGSCFAREIKLWLIEHGYRYILKAEGPCTEAGSARYDRVYNTYTIRQELERAAGRFKPSEPVWDFVEKDGTRRLLDPYRKEVAWEDEEEMVRELAEHERHVREAFSEAEVLIVTLGQSEIWFNRADGRVYPLVPPAEVFDPARHAFRLTTFAENLANMEAVLALYRSLSPQGRILLTVSPVPLRATFLPQSAISANMASKSMLRAVAEELTAAHPDIVSYFPTYEIVTVLEKNAFKDDNRHVRPEVVERIMQLFEAWYVDGGSL
jgi:hypothetical protein